MRAQQPELGRMWFQVHEAARKAASMMLSWAKRPRGPGSCLDSQEEHADIAECQEDKRKGVLSFLSVETEISMVADRAKAGTTRRLRLQ